MSADKHHQVIHFNPRSPHGERLLHPEQKQLHSHFNPRSPHGERHGRFIDRSSRIIFQSPLPAWGATKELAISSMLSFISIPAPRMGSDCALPVCT